MTLRVGLDSPVLARMLGRASDPYRRVTGHP
jgi:hypothetical protein